MKQSVIVIPFHLPWAWKADFMRETATTLARDNTVVCLLTAEPVFFRTIFVEAIRGKIIKKFSERLWLMRPIHFIPLGQFATIQRLNMYINLFCVKSYIRILSFRGAFINKTLWVFSPKFTPYLRLFLNSYTILYDCVDYVWDPSPVVNEKVRREEDELISLSDFVFVNSHALYNVHKKKTKNIFVVPLGFRFNQLKKNVRNSHVFPVGKPLIGFVGVINYRLDYLLLQKVVLSNPQWNFVFCGPIETTVHGEMFHVQEAIDRLKKLSNVFFHEGTTPEKVSEIIRSFDICIIPYNVLYPINVYCYPMKLFEYFYDGKPVISTPIEELRRFPQYVKIGKTMIDWEKYIHFFLSRPWLKVYQRDQRRLAVENSWNKKIDTIIEILKSDT